MAVRRVGVGWGRVVLLAATALVALVVLSQALLPDIAATRVRERVQRYGQVRSISVSAFPAVKLLWGQADKVGVTAGQLAATPRQIGSLLWEARDLGTLTVAAQTGVLRAPQLPAGLAMGDVHLYKRGSSVGASATLTQAQLEAALPSEFSVEPLAASGGSIQARASGALFGVQASVKVAVRAVEGDLVAEPRGLPLGGIARVTLFSDPHLKVQGVGLNVTSRHPLSYKIAVRASLV